MTELDRRWKRVTSREPLGPNSIHIWCLPLDRTTEQLNACRGWLSSDERARAGRYQFEHLRTRFIAGRGAVRAVLGQYLETSPASIQFGYEETGKPYLESAEGENRLRFNVSNSGDLCLIALSREGELGVDIERLRPMANLDGILNRYFAPEEVQAIDHLPEPEKTNAFFRGWTCKEAVLKAKGVGLSVDPAKIVVTVAPNEPARLVRVPPAFSSPSWSLISLIPSNDYVAAVAVPSEDAAPGEDVQLCLFTMAE